LKDLDFLTEKGFITLHTPEMRLGPTAIGASIAKYYLRIPTGVHIMTLGAKCPLKRLLDVLCLASEFEEEVRFRMDKALLTQLSKSLGIRFKVPKIRTIAQKVSLLLQCCLGSVPLTEGSSSAQWTLETAVILKAAQRVIKCIVDHLVEQGDGASLLNALELQASIAAKCWEGSPHFSKQLDGIGPALAQSLANAGMSSLAKILEADTGSLEAACNRNPPFGHRLQELARALPAFALDVLQVRVLLWMCVCERVLEAGARPGGRR
jgi:ATP-dependent DNA helicase HFM1/MER3